MNLLALLLMISLPQTLPYQTSDAPTGLRVSKVEVLSLKNGSLKLQLHGRFSYSSSGNVYLNVTLKKGSQIIGSKDRVKLYLKANQKFTRTVHVKLSDSHLRGVRAYVNFGEVWLD